MCSTATSYLLVSTVLEIGPSSGNDFGRKRIYLGADDALSITDINRDLLLHGFTDGSETDDVGGICELDSNLVRSSHSLGHQCSRGWIWRLEGDLHISGRRSESLRKPF